MQEIKKNCEFCKKEFYADRQERKFCSGYCRNKPRVYSIETRIKMSNAAKKRGYCIDKDTKNKIKEHRISKYIANYIFSLKSISDDFLFLINMRGKKKHTEETKLKISVAKLGKKHHNPHTEEHKDKIRKSMIIDGRTPLTVAIHNSEEYRKWRLSIFKRDGFRCQECFGTKSNKINAHHVKAFKLIFEEFLREFNQFSVVDDKETLIRLAINYKPFWEAEGKTLCKECHKNIRIKRSYKVK